MGLRVQKTDSGGTTNYATDGASPASPVLADTNATYTPGLSERRGSTSKFYHSDALGSTRGITNSSQTATDGLLFDAFGMSVSRTGTTPTPFGFVGAAQYQTDPDSGLQLLGHRSYDASIGRFISSDPAHAGMNWYDYCENNPTRGIDPLGKDLVSAAILWSSRALPIPGVGEVVGIGLIGLVTADLIFNGGSGTGAVVGEIGREIGWIGDRIGDIGRGIGDIGRGIGDWIGDKWRGWFGPKPVPVPLPLPHLTPGPQNPDWSPPDEGAGDAWPHPGEIRPPAPSTRPPYLEPLPDRTPKPTQIPLNHPHGGRIGD